MAISKKSGTVESSIRQYGKGTLPGFDEIFEEYRPSVYGYLLRLTRNSTEAEDLTQETFVKINRSLSSFRADSSLVTWIFRIANNVSVDFFRHKNTHKANNTVSLEERESSGEPITDRDSVTIEKSAERAEMSACVQDFVEELPIDYRTVLVLHDEQGLKNREIADVLGCSLATVKIRLHRARNELKRLLNDGCRFEHDERNVLVCESNSEDS